MQNRQAAQPPKDPGLSNFQDVRFIDSFTIPLASEVCPTQVAPTESQGQWPPQANSITYELKSLDGEVVHETPALAMTTRAMRGNMPVEIKVEEQEDNPLGDVPYFSDLQKVAREARKAIRAMERENEIHDLDGRDVGKWEGTGIPLDEFDSVRRRKAYRVNRYDLWADLSLLKADITFDQLLEISPMARETLKEGMPVP